MLAHIKNLASERQIRLLAIAIARLRWQELPTELRSVIEFATLLADGLASEGDRLRYVKTAYAKAMMANPNHFPAYSAVLKTVGCWRPGMDVSVTPAWEIARYGTANLQPAIIRDIFGNPFKNIVFDRSWITSDVANLASDIYDNNNFNLLPILGESLQKAGCNDRDIIHHCLDRNTHVRGCWVVDNILGFVVNSTVVISQD
ncbi:MAG: hypothetical protein U0871_09470 [Gemmataceae bacterium]